MTESPDYRKYLEERFDGITRLFNAQFEAVHEVLSRVEEQTKITNGRVTELEKQKSEYLKTRVDKDMLSEVCGKVMEVKAELDDVKGEVNDVHRWKANEIAIKNEARVISDVRIRTVMAFAAILGVLLTGFLGFRKVNSEMVRIKTDTELQLQMMLEQRGFAPMGKTRGEMITDTID